jgi:hypothetical protein
MMSEIAGQRINGSPMSERELFGRALESIGHLRDCYRGLALMRNDERWLVPARLMERLQDETKRLMVAKHRPFLIIPRDH